MSLYSIFRIASQGMTAQRERLDAATSNLANAHSTRTGAGGTYQRRDVVFTAIPVDDPSNSSSLGSGSLFNDTQQIKAQGVVASTQLADSTQTIKRFDPAHPDADANGYVSLPDVDPLEETVDMISAARSFEANATAFNTAKELARAALKLGDA